MVHDGGNIPVTDQGSYEEGVLASSDGILWEGWGKARGHPVQSFRAEGYGRMAGACFIGHFIRFFSIPIPDKCRAEFHTDSESLIKRRKTVRDTTVASAYHRLKFDDDVIRAIEDHESRIPMVIIYHWVEGHQDKTKAVGELPWPAQLNVRADELATEAINSQAHTPQAPKLIPLVQTSMYYYLIQGKTPLIGHEVRALRTSIPTQKIKTYLLERHNWDEKIFKSIAVLLSKANCSTKIIFVGVYI
jgi:hypothetical protein